MQNLPSFSMSLNSELPAFGNAARHPNTETDMQCSDDRSMSSVLTKFGEVESAPPENRVSDVLHPLKLHRENMLNHQ